MAVKRGSRKPKAPSYTAKKNRKYLYTKKGDDMTKRSNPKGNGRMQATIALIVKIVVTTETMILLETTTKK